MSFFHNAIASFDELTLSGDPAPPLPFPRAITGRAERVNGTIYHPASGTYIEITNYNIIFQQPQSNAATAAAAAPQPPPNRAYWVGRTLRHCIYGMVKHCTIVRYQPETDVWEVTPEEAAVKIMSWQRIRDLSHVEDPQKEVAALQYISRRGQHVHVMGALDVLEDDEYLLLFMRLCSSGDLYSLLEQAGNFSESMARYWFRQILDVSEWNLINNGHTTKKPLLGARADNILFSRLVDLRFPTVSPFSNQLDPPCLSLTNHRVFLICNAWACVIATCRWKMSSLMIRKSPSLLIWACVCASPFTRMVIPRAMPSVMLPLVRSVV